MGGEGGERHMTDTPLKAILWRRCAPSPAPPRPPSRPPGRPNKFFCEIYSLFFMGAPFSRAWRRAARSQPVPPHPPQSPHPRAPGPLVATWDKPRGGGAGDGVALKEGSDGRGRRGGGGGRGGSFQGLGTFWGRSGGGGGAGGAARRPPTGEALQIACIQARVLVNYCCLQRWGCPRGGGGDLVSRGADLSHTGRLG